MNWKNRKPCEWLPANWAGSKTFAMVDSYTKDQNFRVLRTFERGKASANHLSEGSGKILRGFKNLRGLVSNSSKLKYYLNALSIIALFSIFVSCESTTKSDNIYEEFQPGIYKYSGYDDNDDLFVSGKLRLHFGEDSSLVGSWEMDAVAAGKTDHPHFGQGDLGGGIDNDTLWCNLHPGWRDHNIFLRGYYENGEITGEWSYISFIGYTSGGKFKAKYFSAEE